MFPLFEKIKELCQKQGIFLNKLEEEIELISSIKDGGYFRTIIARVSVLFVYVLNNVYSIDSIKPL